MLIKKTQFLWVQRLLPWLNVWKRHQLCQRLGVLRWRRSLWHQRCQLRCSDLCHLCAVAAFNWRSVAEWNCWREYLLSWLSRHLTWTCWIWLGICWFSQWPFFVTSTRKSRKRESIKGIVWSILEGVLNEIPVGHCSTPLLVDAWFWDYTTLFYIYIYTHYLYNYIYTLCIYILYTLWGWS